MKKEIRIGIESEIRTVDSGKRIIEGYAARFGKLSEDLGGFREKIKAGAFAEALKTSDVRALFNHDPNHVLGRSAAGTLELHEDGKGLHMRVKLPNTRTADELMESIDRGDITQQSFGFTIAEDSWRRSEKHGEVRTIEKVSRLYDVSPVTYPAYPDTSVAVESRDLWLATSESEEIVFEHEGTEYRFRNKQHLYGAIDLFDYLKHYRNDDPTKVEPVLDDDADPTKGNPKSNISAMEEILKERDEINRRI